MEETRLFTFDFTRMWNGKFSGKTIIGHERPSSGKSLFFFLYYGKADKARSYSYCIFLSIRKL